MNGVGGVYCEDCNISHVVPDDSNDFTGVRQWAVASDIAEQLWDETALMLARLEFILPVFSPGPSADITPRFKR